ncbi:MAG: hypothetical protein ACRD45_13955, partial [Bryobacteraceae bacterium]
HETIELERRGCECMTLRSTRTRERHYNYSDATAYSLMNEELAVIGADPAFDTAFDHAREILRNAF